MAKGKVLVITFSLAEKLRLIRNTEMSITVLFPGQNLMNKMIRIADSSWRLFSQDKATHSKVFGILQELLV